MFSQRFTCVRRSAAIIRFRIQNNKNNKKLLSLKAHRERKQFMLECSTASHHINPAIQDLAYDNYSNISDNLC